MATVKLTGKAKVYEGTGTKTAPIHTGHGAPTPIKSKVGAMQASTVGGNRRLKKLNKPVPGVQVGGFYAQIPALTQGRFVQPDNASTLQSPNPSSGLGCPMPDRTPDGNVA